MKKWMLLVGLILIFTGCTDPGPGFPEGEVLGYQPVYAVDSDFEIELLPRQAAVNTGKIFRRGNLLLLSEVNEGIHIIDNTDPTAPVNLGFLKVKGSSDMWAEGELLYVNQFSDIVTVDFSDLENVREISREPNAFSAFLVDQQIPPLAGFYFVCPDSTRGRIVDWQLVNINQPKCFR